MGKDLNGKELGKGLSQRPDGKYYARAVVKGKSIGIYDSNLSKLKKRFEEEKALALVEKDSNPIQKEKITLNDWFYKWFTVTKAPTLKGEVNQKIYERKVRNTYLRHIGDKFIDELTQMDIQDATNKLAKEEYTKRSIQEGLGVIKQCLNIALANDIIVKNPVLEINIGGSVTQKERRVMSLEEQNIFLEEIKGSYYYEMYCILLSTGMRIGELSALTWEDIDFENECIHITKSMQTGYFDGKKLEYVGLPKTQNSIRDIPFFEDTKNYFISWKKKQDNFKRRRGDSWRCNPEHGDIVFTTTVGSPVTRYVVCPDLNKIVDNINKKEMYKACKEGRMPNLFEHLHPHAFRHTFVTRALEKGLDPFFVTKIAGHTSFEVTMTYVHVLDDTIRKNVIKAGNFL